MNAQPPREPEGTASRQAGRVDGRRLRSERTRQLIIEAYMTLVRENLQMPTAAQIAERAGYSVRSIFERFPDLLALRVAATDYAIAEGRNQGALRDVDADRATRIRSQVDARARGCERWLPLWRVLSSSPTESEDLRKRIRLVRDLVRMRFEMMFKAELSVLPEPQRRHLLVALEAITDYESWGRMRELYGLSFEEACDVWIDAIDRLLPVPAVS
jgi:AcrR family transcriptional regulator